MVLCPVLVTDVLRGSHQYGVSEKKDIKQFQIFKRWMVGILISLASPKYIVPNAPSIECSAHLLSFWAVKLPQLAPYSEIDMQQSSIIIS